MRAPGCGRPKAASSTPRAASATGWESARWWAWSPIRWAPPRCRCSPEDDGIIVGRTNLPIVNRGDAVFHIAKAKPLSTIRQHPDEAVALADEDEII